MKISTVTLWVLVFSVCIKLYDKQLEAPCRWEILVIDSMASFGTTFTEAGVRKLFEGIYINTRWFSTRYGLLSCPPLLLSSWQLCKGIFGSVINNSTVQDQKEFGDDQQTSGGGKTFDGDHGGPDQQFEAEGDRCDNATDCTDKVQNRKVADNDENEKDGIENTTLENGTVRQEHFLRKQQHGVNQCYNK